MAAMHWIWEVAHVVQGLQCILMAIMGKVSKSPAAGLPALKAKPAMLAEGMRDKAIPPAMAIADFEGVWPGRPIVRMPDAGHFCQEDVPDTLVALIEQFIQANA